MQFVLSVDVIRTRIAYTKARYRESGHVYQVYTCYLFIRMNYQNSSG
jgi:hypothetical protein